MSNPELIGLIQSLEAMAEAALGELSPLQNQMRLEGAVNNSRGRSIAERNLKMLNMLKEKTRGNLDFDEAEILGGAIANLANLLERLA
jgi:hypothetical protein